MEEASKGMNESKSDGISECTAKSDVHQKMWKNSSRGIDSLVVMEGSNKPIDCLLDTDGFTDGDLEGLKEIFDDDDGHQKLSLKVSTKELKKLDLVPMILVM